MFGRVYQSDVTDLHLAVHFSVSQFRNSVVEEETVLSLRA